VASRYESSPTEINAFTDNDSLFFHDAVRPNLSQRNNDECAAAINPYSAVDIATPKTDTIIQVKDGVINGIPPRHLLWNGQTPQCFHRSLIRSAYQIALQDPFFKPLTIAE
jgi:2-C-methyl-D-erythritol 4-phosphate cytidylyltransferase